MVAPAHTDVAPEIFAGIAVMQKSTHKNLSKEESVRLKKFLFLPMEDLKKIKPVWVVEENKSEAYFGPFDDYEIEYISPKLLIDNANMLNLPTDNLFNNDIDDFRYITTLERWQEKRSVDPPTKVKSMNINYSFLIICNCASNQPPIGNPLMAQAILALALP